MFYEVKTINGVKTKVPLTNSSGVVAGGNPIGTIISTYKKIKPANYLYCDGSTFDPEIYPGLYLYLGTNVLPDYRECAMVGAEKNTTNVFDSTETDPSTGLPGTQSHDVYTEGEFKDDQFQGHAIQTTITTNSGPTELRRLTNTSGYTNNFNLDKIVSDGTNGTPRIGSTTHGKQKAVFYYIKAVDGVDITDEDAFLGEVKDFVEDNTQPKSKVWVGALPDTGATALNIVGIVIPNASKVTSIGFQAIHRAGQADPVQYVYVDLVNNSSFWLGLGVVNATITISGTYDSANDTWTITNTTAPSIGFTTVKVNYSEDVTVKSN